MGPEDSEVEGLVLYTVDGEKIGKIQNLAEVTVSAGKEIASVMGPAMAGLSMTISVKPAKGWRCRSRKRFIKLLMSKGYSRNYAVRFAARARRVGIPYQDIWRTWFIWE